MDIIDIKEAIKQSAVRVLDNMHAYDEAHVRPNAIDGVFAVAVGGVGVAAEVAAAKLEARPNSVPNVIGRLGLHGVAVGSAFCAARIVEDAIHD